MPAYSENVDMGVVKFINQPVLLGKASRPKASEVMAQSFRFAGSGGWIAPKHFFENRTKILVHPFIALPEIFVDFP